LHLSCMQHNNSSHLQAIDATLQMLNNRVPPQLVALCDHSSVHAEIKS